ncbi:E3 ubiquitin/ISG15 ligase TRIM25-like [Spea bombifrons]|uniref:E3 ubiquitin/ISG15 ligase TRIM25-like n=1 Tax=Spea bombifrons TaxID=233779 RepID=UPI00234AF3C0|nr:E3 ubiquitin/ISG15 ligase TRIM25-like [Spea bombifrons]
MAGCLGDIAEDLSCSICLGPFQSPVSTPCGHNFCSECLGLTWKGANNRGFTCPQCRYPFPEKPELRKNTLLSSLVDRIMEAKGNPFPGQQEDLLGGDLLGGDLLGGDLLGGDLLPALDPLPARDLLGGDPLPSRDLLGGDPLPAGCVLCDHCMKAAAARTCLTCMASFCPEHLQPHHESPAFKDHELTEPVKDLTRRKCSDHGKLLDYYCWGHGRCLCCSCLPGHRQCQTLSLREGKRRRELEVRNLLQSLTQKIKSSSNKADDVITEQRKVMDITQKKKDLVLGEFNEIQALIEGEKAKAMRSIEEEEKKVVRKFSFTHQVLGKKQREFQALKVRVESLLQEEDELQFLKRSAEMQDVPSKEPYKPKIEFNEKLLHQIYRRAASLKNSISHNLQQPDDPSELKCPHPVPQESPEKEHRQDESSERKPQMPKKTPREKKKQPPKTMPKKHPSAPTAAAANRSREELLKYAERLVLDINTAHKRVLLSDRFTTVTVSDKPQDYAMTSERFTHCSQVLCTRGLSHGIHYWEVGVHGGNFSGIGVAYRNIARTGVESRLGRNKESWCIEWFNGKLQAWHADRQTDLAAANIHRVGVLLHYDEGFLAFFSVADEFREIYRFRAQFAEPLYPAFWVFSSNTTLSVTPLNE